MIDWKPIESAPKDGTIIIVKSGVGSVHSVRWETYQGKTSWFDFAKGWIPSARCWTEYD